MPLTAAVNELIASTQADDQLEHSKGLNFLKEINEMPERVVDALLDEAIDMIRTRSNSKIEAAIKRLEVELMERDGFGEK